MRSTDVDTLLEQHIAPVHVTNFPVEAEKTIPDFFNTQSVIVPDPSPNISDPYNKLLELDLMREETVLTIVGQPVSEDVTVAIPAATATGVQLPNVNYSLEGFDITLSAAGSVAGTVTVTNGLAGTFMYDIPIGTTSLSIRFPSPIRHDPSKTVSIKVAISAITGAGAGHIQAYGLAVDGGNVYVAHSANQASAIALQVSQLIADNQHLPENITSGALLNYGSVRIKGSAPLWLVASQNTDVIVSIVEIRRGKDGK